MHDAAVIAGHSQRSLSVSTSAASMGPLEGGAYEVWCESDAFVRVAQTAEDAETVTSSTGYIVPANTPTRIAVPHGWCLGAIIGEDTDTLRLHQIG